MEINIYHFKHVLVTKVSGDIMNNIFGNVLLIIIIKMNKV